LEGLDLNNLFGLSPLDPGQQGELHDHVEELAAKHGLTCREEAIGWLDAEATFDEGWFCSPILRTEFDYLTALHEIGHLVLDLDTEDADGAILHSNEVEAWKWAIEEARITPSEAARDQIMVAFQTHGDDVGPTSEELDRLRAALADTGAGPTRLDREKSEDTPPEQPEDPPAG